MITSVDTNLSTAHGLLKVWYLGHSSYVVETKGALLIFDYVETGEKLVGFEDSNMLNLLDYKDKSIFVLISHEHDDHFDETVFHWSDRTNNIEFILGWEGSWPENCISVLENRKAEVGKLSVSTIKATDDGVGFLVKVDGKSILHLGDHANWAEELWSVYKEQIDEIAMINSNIDIAFTPVAKGSGGRPQCILDGVVYMTEKLNPTVVFPMHSNGKEYLYKEFYEDIILKNNAFVNRIKYANNLGQEWELNL